MFERFTERARQVIVLAQEDARARHHNWIGGEHVLMGLIRETEGLAARVLVNDFGITDEVYSEWLAQNVPDGDEHTSGQIPFTPRAKTVMEHALREALSLGHNYIGTEHILLALIRQTEGTAAEFIKEHGTTSEAIREEIMRMLSVRKPRVPPVAEPETPSHEQADAHDFPLEREGTFKLKQPTVDIRTETVISVVENENYGKSLSIFTGLFINGEFDSGTTDFLPVKKVRELIDDAD